MRRIFVDANVLIAGAHSRSGASNAVLQMAEIGKFEIMVCNQVLDEAERNLRKKLPGALPNFAAQMARLRLTIIPDPSSEETAPWENVVAPKDAPILCAAIQGDVARLTTLDTRHFTPEVAAQSGLAIQTPADLVEDIRRLVTINL
ncbi:MAG: PIN domain-containing protein [Chloroflexota bacterium]|nr:PIN domain-containing protein [Chloroflexota bacterium]